MPEKKAEPLTLLSLPYEILSDIIQYLDLNDLFTFLSCFRHRPVGKALVTKNNFLLMLENTASHYIYKDAEQTVCPVSMKDKASYLARHLFTMFEKRENALFVAGHTKDHNAWPRFFRKVWRSAIHFGDKKLLTMLNHHATFSEICSERLSPSEEDIFFWCPVRDMLIEMIDARAIKGIHWLVSHCDKVMQEQDISSDSEHEDITEIDHIGIIASVLPTFPPLDELWKAPKNILDSCWSMMANAVRQEELWEGGFGLYI